MVNQLASEYAGQNVVFLEQNFDAPLGGRLGLYWFAHGYGSTSLPTAIIDSGQQYHEGWDGSYTNQYTSLKAMVDTALARPAKGDVSATWERVGNQVHVEVQVTNQSGVTLASTTNDAYVTVLVYEDVQVHYTSRWVRAAAFTPIPSLANGATGSYTVNTTDLSGVDWSKLHTVVVVDYFPGGAATAYDVINSAVAEQVVQLGDERVYLPLAVR